MIGLGKDGEIKTINIFWPGSGTTQTFSGVDSNAWYLVTENESISIKK
jgi:predicted NUDIX family NTP pyrophosphohydrolase